VGPDASTRAVVGLFAAVFVFMLADTTLQTILPVTLARTGAASAGLIGVMVALPQGVGFLTALPASAYGDRHGRARLSAIAAVVAAGGAILAIATVGRSAPWWLLPVLAIGLARLVVWTSVLAMVSTTGDPHRMQGLNGATQRAAAGVAAILCALVVARQAWWVAFCVIAAAFAVLAPLSRSALRRGPVARDATPSPRSSYGLAADLSVRDPALRAASLVALLCTGVMVLGSSFFALTLRGDRDDIARTLAVLLLARDGVSIVVSPFLPRLLRRLGLQGTVALATASGTLGVLGLAVPLHHWAWIALTAALQGTCICLSIGCTNLLAVDTRSGRVAGPGLRIASANLAPCLGGLTLPVAMGAILGNLGSAELFVAVAAATAGFGAVALVAIRTLGMPSRVSVPASVPVELNGLPRGVCQEAG
jgi:hypothetical protein